MQVGGVKRTAVASLSRTIGCLIPERDPEMIIFAPYKKKGSRSCR